MQRAKAFFVVCAGVFLLALSYHLGARNAGAQAASAVTGLSMGPRFDGGPGTGVYVLTPNGDLYFNFFDQFGAFNQTRLIGNFWNGATPVQHETLGSVKAKYR